MIYILHGENIPYARNLILNQFKKLGSQNKVEIEINEISPNQLLTACSTIDIFGINPFVVFDVSLAVRKNTNEYIEVLSKIPINATLIIFSSKKLTQANAFIKTAKNLKAKIIICDNEATWNVFKFIDNLFNKDRKKTYQELDKLINADQDEFYIFSMILFQLRNIAAVAFDSSLIQSMAPFIRMKTKKQIKNFESEKLKSLFEFLYNIDKESKTGLISKELTLILSMEKILSV